MVPPVLTCLSGCNRPESVRAPPLNPHAYACESSSPPFTNRSQVMTHPITPPKGNPVLLLPRTCTLSRRVRRRCLSPWPVPFRPSILRTCFSSVVGPAVSIVPRYRTVRERGDALCGHLPTYERNTRFTRRVTAPPK